MQADLLPFIDWNNHARQIIAPQDQIITAGDPTDMLFLLDQGVALAPNDSLRNQPPPINIAKIACDNGNTYRAGALLSLLEMLSLDAYRHDVTALEECRVIGINRTEIKTMWNRGSKLGWPLSCSIAATITQRRQTRFLI